MTVWVTETKTKSLIARNMRMAPTGLSSAFKRRSKAKIPARETPMKWAERSWSTFLWLARRCCGGIGAGRRSRR